MKRTLGILLALTMVLSMFAAISVSAAATYEFTFEEGSGTTVGELTKEGWKVRKMYGTGDTGKFNNNVTPTTAVVHGGTQGVQYKAYNKNSGLISTPLDRLGAGKSYNISAWSFQESLVDEMVKVKMMFSGGTSKEFSAPAEAGTWVEVKGEFTVPEGETAQLVIISSSTSNAIHYWDDIVIASTTGDDNPAPVQPEAPAEDKKEEEKPAVKFGDLGTHAWAEKEITEMAEKGIVYGVSETEFKPGQNITRADFAAFLINTLGLTSDSTENFADVSADAPYAKQLAIGKALGILNGVGDNNYNPNAEISRQDLMVICARGMRAVNKLQATGGEVSFPDAGLIADYAKADVSAMVQDGVIKGNADGTINPLGNATRAEAAIIMHRIYNK